MRKITTLFVLGALIFTSCSEKAVKEEKEKEYPVKVVTVEKAMINQEYDFTGNIEPMAKNIIASAAAQRIEKIHVEIGTKVKKGDLLVEMENVNYLQAKIQTDNLKIDLARIEALYKAGGVAEQQYTQLKTQVSIAEESLSNLQKNTRLLSPIDGVVVQKNFYDGDLATGQPILVVMQMQPVKTLIAISEEFFPQTTPGTPVELSLDIYPDKVFPGKIMLIHPTIDPNTRTFTAEVRIENPALLIRPGMFVRVRVNFGAKERVIIPDKAVIKQTGTNDRYVYTLDGDIVNYTKVELGRRIGSVYEVISGVKEGEKIVVAGNTTLSDKTKVKVTVTDLNLTR